MLPRRTIRSTGPLARIRSPRPINVTDQTHGARSERPIILGRADNLLARIGVPLATIAGLVAAWQVVVAVFPIPAFILPGPVAVWRTAAAFGANWLPHLLATMQIALAGFALAAIVGVALAVIIVHSRTLSRVLTPVIVILQIVPKIAFAPLFLVWFGLGPVPIVVITFLVAFFPMVINTAVSLAEVEPELLDLTRVLRLSTWRVLWTVRFPGALPHIFSGLKVASTLAVVGAIIGEFVGSNRGLGYLILIANNNLNTPLALAAISMVSLFGLALYGAIVLIEAVSMPWRPGSLAPEATP